MIGYIELGNRLRELSMNFRRKLTRTWKLTRIFPCRLQLITFLFLNRKLPVDVLFEQAWKIVDRSSALAAPKKNTHQIPIRHFLHHELRQIFKLLFPVFSPVITIADSRVLEDVRGQKLLITTIHTKCEYALLAVLDRFGFATSIISAHPIKEELLANYIFQTPPHNILRTRSSFLDARSVMRSGRIIVCDVDFVTARETVDAERYISTSAFDFCRTVHGKLCFAYTRIASNGRIECIIESADIESGLPTASDQIAASFIAFVDRVQGHPSNFKIANWSKNADQGFKYVSDPTTKAPSSPQSSTVS